MKFMNSKKLQKLMIAALILCGILWGLSGVLGQILFEQTYLSVEFLTGIRMVISGTIILFFLILTDRKNLLNIWRSPKIIVFFLFFAIIAAAGVQYTYFKAIESSNAATATVIQYTYPILVLIVKCFEEKRTPSKIEFCSIIMAVLGIFFISTHGSLSSLKISLEALLWGLASACAFTLFTLLPVKLYKNFGQLPVMGWAFLTGGLFILTVSGSLTEYVQLNSFSMLLIAGIAILGTLIPFALYGKGVEVLGSVKASLIVTIEPVASAVMAFIFTGTTFGFIDIAGFILIIAAVLIINSGKSQIINNN